MSDSDSRLIFPSDLGWMAVVVTPAGAVRRLTFGHRSAAAAEKAVAVFNVGSSRENSRGLTAPGMCSIGGDSLRGLLAPGYCDNGNYVLAQRLQKYAAGTPDSLADIPVDFGPLSPFQRRVLEQCRQIPYGKTMSYTTLAGRAGSPNAARAVGNCMKNNPIPLLIPCHRVVCSDGRLGNYSAPGGTPMKRQLLALESNSAGDA